MGQAYRRLHSGTRWSSSRVIRAGYFSLLALAGTGSRSCSLR
jgi:hypothetical protein